MPNNKIPIYFSENPIFDFDYFGGKRNTFFEIGVFIKIMETNVIFALLGIGGVEEMLLSTRSLVQVPVRLRDLERRECCCLCPTSAMLIEKLGEEGEVLSLP